MMRSTFRLTVKQHRLVLTILVAGMVLAAVASFVASAFMHWLTTSTEILTCYTGDVFTPDCERLFLVAMVIEAVGYIGAIVPGGLALAAGMLLGVPLVGDEIEKGTAVLAWTLAPTRRGWLLRRILILGSVMTAVSLLTAVSSDTFIQAGKPYEPIGAAFTEFDNHGWMILVRGLAAFAAGTFAGALLGRMLPALIAGVALAGILMLGAGAWTSYEINDWPAIQLPQDAVGAHVSDWRWVEPSTGVPLSSQELYDKYGDAGWELSQSWQQIQFGLPGEAAPLFTARQICVLVVGITILFGASFVVVERRRPY